MTAVEIAPLEEGHWSVVREIYAQGIASGNATFESAAPDWPDWDSRQLPCCRFVAQSGNRIVGWAALSRVSTRRVYAGVAEVSIYIAAQSQGRGIGNQLLAALVTESERNGIWTLQAGIFPENHASIKLHQRAGFRIVGTRERIGCIRGTWRDTVLMERRSATVGI